MSVLRATLRLQFHRDFTLDDATAIVPYLHRLGISHVYASPLFTARPGSTHGYDIIDPNRVNPELGGEDALVRLVAALRSHRMGLILDIVPNHMAVGGDGNAWWQDVLEWGRASPYAEYFDIDWQSATPGLRGRVLAPFLGDPYGVCLREGQIGLRFDPEDGRLYAAYFDDRFPLAPRDYPAVLAGDDALAAAVRPLAAMPRERDAARTQAAAVRTALRDPALEPAIAAALAAFDPAGPEGRARLHEVLERQAYRLAWWRASEQINWRRFFDINGLAGLRVERAEVFEATHAGVLRLYAEGLIDGVRIDHVDGLADPSLYCRTLRRRLAGLAARRPPGLPSGPAPIWVEKILADGENLPAEWQTDGTTGYDFMDQAAAVLHDPAGAPMLTAAWVRATGRPGAFAVEVEAARRQVIDELLPGETEALAAALQDVALEDPLTRDYTLPAIRRVLHALLARFPVYRIYAGRGGLRPADAAVMEAAVAGARATLRPPDHALLHLLAGWLGGAEMRELPAAARARRLRAMVRFQQLTAPAVAKSVEDTAFYRYGRLLSRNEVGSDPAVFARPPEAFHAAMLARRRHLPQALLATATHDHKRGEDARARLAVLSELPDVWTEAVAGWMRRTAAWRRRPVPDAADEAMVYQSMVGAWPPGLTAGDTAGLAALGARLAGWQEKALREAKRLSTWALPDAVYEAGCQRFLARLLDPAHSAGLTDEIARLVARIGPAGALNGLAQATLRLTVPGVPDMFQGTEFWDFSLVDPDNRQAVDFAARDAALDPAVAPGALLGQWQDGRVKQALIARLLGLRARLPGVFGYGSYAPLRLTGALAAHALAFVRTESDRAVGGRAVVVVVSRLAARLPGVERAPLVTPAAWEDTAVLVPPRLRGRPIADALDDRAQPPSGRRLRLAEVLETFPVAVLVLG
ncbi:MAG: malto-oligosyltrehalose synthase [Proteobacteria bacterium]|nr:malto-oligosyltrehalose synthase [Pseudomonadota bacterium]